MDDGPRRTRSSVCEIDFRVGGKARYVWKNPEFEMGMTAEFKEIVETRAHRLHRALRWLARGCDHRDGERSSGRTARRRSPSRSST